MTIYAIRHKPTGNYILQRNRVSGGTFEEPLPWTGKRHPRFFPNPTNAKKALTAWLKGAWEESYSKHWETGELEYEGPCPIVRPERRREDMEIVEFKVEEAV